MSFQVPLLLTISLLKNFSLCNDYTLGCDLHCNTFEEFEVPGMLDENFLLEVIKEPTEEGGYAGPCSHQQGEAGGECETEG